MATCRHGRRRCGRHERFFAVNKVKRECLDNRLSAEHTLKLYGLAPTAGCGIISTKTWGSTARLQYLVSKEPNCLVILDGPRGPWFIPIDQAWVDAAGETYIPSNYGRPRTRYTLLKDHVSTEMSHDAHGLIGGVRINPQPPGRYMSMPDLIAAWNRSLGWCGQQKPDGSICGRPIYLEWNHDWDEYEEQAQPINLACIQRRDNTMFHFSWNLADKLVCARCSGDTKQAWRRDERACSHTRPAERDGDCL